MALRPPPRYANMPSGDLFDRELSDGLFRTLAQLHALAWQSRGERTPPATMEELAQLRGLRVRQMYTHLSELKKRRRIRVENLTDGRRVIYPLRWELGAALPADESSSFNKESELAELLEEAALPLRWEEGAALSEVAGERRSADWPARNLSLKGIAKNCSDAPPEGEVIAKNCNNAPPGGEAIAKNCSNAPPEEGVTAKNCSRFPKNGKVTAKNCSKSPDEPDFTAKNCSGPMLFKHVVVDSNTDLKQQHEHGDFTAKNCSNSTSDKTEGLARAIADIFIEDGDAPGTAIQKATALINEYGARRCQRQLDAFPARCDLARASPRGLDNPSGLLIASIKNNWTVSSKASRTSKKPWYTAEEFENIILH